MCSILEQNQVVGSEGETSSRVKAWRPAQLVPAHAPGHGDNHGVDNCGAHGVLCLQGFPLLQRLHPERRVEQDPIPRPRGDAECYGAYSDVGVPHAAGAPPPV